MDETKIAEIALTVSIAFIFGYLALRPQFSLKAAQKAYKSRNITEKDLECGPNEFMKKLIKLFGGKMIPYQDTMESPILEFHFFSDLKGMQLGSLTGEKIDYFLVVFQKAVSGTKILCLDPMTPVERAARFLTEQNFHFCKIENQTAYFRKNDMNLRLRYDESNLELQQIEMVRDGVPAFKKCV